MIALAAAHLSPLAALPSAFASVWQVLIGTFLALFWSKRTHHMIKPRDKIIK
ncbi:hypothetical protein [Bacillus sp. M6-12]|uniref:hypothetical protein n=1 Tax=Bacillus sp. M6-12 TaxID=2054166 RepID=UPI0015E15026